MNTLYILIGAAGVGKTTAVKKIDAKRDDIAVCYFDAIGVPSHEEMVREYGSPEEWQRAKTIEWVGRLNESELKERDVILDTQTRPVFVHEACKQHGVRDYKIILFDCEDDVRAERLAERGQPELETPDMQNWARYLREQCQADSKCEIFNTSETPVDWVAEQLLKKIRK